MQGKKSENITTKSQITGKSSIIDNSASFRALLDAKKAELGRNAFPVKTEIPQLKANNQQTTFKEEEAPQSLIKISSIVNFGDSLSDAGTMHNRKLFGLIPMDKLAGTTGFGRFSDTYVWRDHFVWNLIEKFVFDELTKDIPLEKLDNFVNEKMQTVDQLKTFIESKPKGFWDPLLNLYKVSLLNDDRKVMFNKEVLLRSYAEGGASAATYGFNPFIPARSIVSNLHEKLAESIADDRQLGISLEKKAETLVIEWTGANDLITVNTDLPINRKPTEEEKVNLIKIAEVALEARINHIKALQKNGYKHFVLFNLPDLGLTPRFHDKEGQETATWITEEFNKALEYRCKRLQDEWRREGNDAVVSLGDVNTKFKKIYHGCKDPFSDLYRNTFQKAPGIAGTIQEKMCMFNDDVHPCSELHRLLTEEVMAEFNQTYNFVVPNKIEAKKEELLKNFKTLYTEKVNQDNQRCFGVFGARSTVNTLDDQNNIVPGLGKKADLTLEEILHHALFKGGTRSRAVIRELGWIDSDNTINSAYKEVVKAYRQVENAYKNENVRDKQNYTEKEIFWAIISLGMYSMLREVIGIDPKKEMSFENYAEVGVLAVGFILTAPISGPMFLLMSAINSYFRSNYPEITSKNKVIANADNEGIDGLPLCS